MTTDVQSDEQRRHALNRALHEAITQGWVIESRTDLSVSLRRGKLNNPAWFIVSLVTTPFICGLGFVAWGIAAALNRSKRLTIWVNRDGTVSETS